MTEQEVLNAQKAKDRRNNIIVIVLAAILVVVVVLFMMQRREHNVILNEIKAEKDSIQFELTEIAASYDSLSTENDTLNEQLYVAQAKVKDLLLEVEQTKEVSFRKINTYQKSITTMRGIMQHFARQVDSLNQINKQLIAENIEVKEQYKKVEQEKEQLTQEKSRLQQNLQRAAMMQARELLASPLNSRSKPTKYAKRTEKIRIYFVLSKNVTTKRGTKNIFARITRPDQMLLSKSANNLFRFEDVRIQYSAMREIVYEGKDLPVTVWWDNTNEPELMPGEYSVDLFADGNVIGETSFTIR